MRGVTGWCVFFTALVGVIQLGALEREVMDWDESAFILVASNVLGGNLPYVHAFETKPPGIYIALAGGFALFGETLWTVRLIGDLAILVMAIFTFLISRRLSSDLAAGLATGAMVAMTVPSFGQWTSSELPATALLMAAAWVMVCRPRNLLAAALAGVFMSLAALMRLNLAIPALGIGIYYGAALFRHVAHVPRYSLLAYGLGGLGPLGTLMAVYWYAGHLDLLIVCMFKVPFVYATQQMSMLDAFMKHANDWMEIIRYQPIIFGLLSFLLLVGAAVFSLWAVPGGKLSARHEDTKTVSGKGMEIALLAWLFIAVLVSILAGGAAYTHYWLQLYPFAALLIALGITLAPWKWLRWVQQLGCLTIICAAVYLSWPSFVRVISDPGGVSARHVMRDVAARIEEDRRPRDKVWALKHHIILWYLKQDPLSAAGVHPFSLTLPAVIGPLVEAGLASPNEVERIMYLRPRYVIPNRVTKSEGPHASFFSSEQNRDLADLLAAEYERWIEMPGTAVYRRMVDN